MGVVRWRRSPSSPSSFRLYDTAELADFYDIVIARAHVILARHQSDRTNNGCNEGTNNRLQILGHTAQGFTNPTNF